MDTRPRYNARLLSLPITTAVSSHSHPDQPRVGPWPLKRSISDSGASKLKILREAINEPGLSQVLSKIDEECAVIDNIVIAPNEKTITNASTTIRVKQKRKHQSGMEQLYDFFLYILVICAVCLFVATPGLTFTFANKDWGRLMLPKDAPSKAAFGFLLAVPVWSTGVAFYFAFFCTLALKHHWQLRSRADGLLHALMASFTGFFHVGFVLAWLLPLIGHD